MMKKMEPAVTAEDTDDAILAMLTSHPGLIEITRDEADRAFRRCCALPQAPNAWLLWKLEGFQKLGVAEDRVARYRHLMSAVVFFTTFAERYGRIANLEGLRALHRELDDEMTRETSRLRWQAQNQSVPVPFFDARGFVLGLASRGLSFSETPEGDLRAFPAFRLTDADRTVIQQNVDAVKVAAAGLSETF